MASRDTKSNAPIPSWKALWRWGLCLSGSGRARCTHCPLWSTVRTGMQQWQSRTHGPFVGQWFWRPICAQYHQPRFPEHPQTPSAMQRIDCRISWDTAFGRGPRMTHYHPVGVSREDHPLRGMTRRHARKQNDSLCYTQFEQNGLSQKGWRGTKHSHHQIPKNKSGNAVHRGGTGSVLPYQRLQ